MRSAVTHAHELLRAAIAPGDTVIDATAGNGHDTLFLARLVSPHGKVLAFDIQPGALTNTRLRLEDAGIPETVFQLIPAGHETMAGHLPPSLHGKIAAVVFNLGYLPGGDKNVITGPRTTLAAMQSALSLLGPRGVLVAVLYTGHPGGPEEEEAVQTFANNLSSGEWSVTSHRAPQTLRPAPSVLQIQRSR